MGALTGAISGAIGFGIGWANTEFLNGVLSDFSVALVGGTLGGGIGAELQGGSFWEGAQYGALGATIGYSLTRVPQLTRFDRLQSQFYAEHEGAMASSSHNAMINDYKFGHANSMSILQRLLGPLATPFLAAAGILYEIYHTFVPGHRVGEPTNYAREAPFYGITDGQHPLNWLWDTPGDLAANVLGQATGLFLSPAAAVNVNQAAFLIPGPDYRNQPWTDLARPGAAWPW